MIVLCQWILSQLLKENYENWDTEHSMVAYSGSNTDCKSSEPLKTLVMLCYVKLPCRTTNQVEKIFTWSGVRLFQAIPVNRKIIYMMENLQKNRTFSMSYGSLLESEDLLGRRLG